MKYPADYFRSFSKQLLEYQHFFLLGDICGLNYKHLTIVKDDPSTVNKFIYSHTDAARVIIYDHQMFIVQATGGQIFNTY